MANVQLGEKEQMVVYVDQQSKRILGFCSTMVKPMFPRGTKYDSHTCMHASDIEKWANRMRLQDKSDWEDKNDRQLLREAPFRAATRNALLERRRHLDAPNRAMNDAIMKLMDNKYLLQMAQKRQVESYLPAEKYEMGTSGEDVALENPALRIKQDG